MTGEVHRRLPIVLTLIAWLIATGAHWDMVQTFAWARMFSENARTMTMGAALARTFSPEGACEMCSAVSTAKQQQEQTPDGSMKSAGKTLLVYLPSRGLVISAPDVSSFVAFDPAMSGIARAQPPVPPPRG